jgi:hypothetical protein
LPRHSHEAAGGGAAPLPETLETTASGDRFSAYRIRKPAVDLSR